VLEELAAALDTDDVIRSAAAGAWVEAASADLKYLVRELRSSAGNVDHTIVSTGAFGVLFPARTVPA